MTRLVDKTGRVYGYLTVRKLREKRSASGRVVWICECKCGNEVAVESNRLLPNGTRSCGCLRGESHRKRHALIVAQRLAQKSTPEPRA